MAKPLSSDLRKRIIDAKLRDDTEGKIAVEKGAHIANPFYIIVLARSIFLLRTITIVFFI